MTQQVNSEAELGNLVFDEIKNHLEGGFVVGLSGELGAGKTTLVQQIAAKLGVEDSITSPTFNLCKLYDVKGDWGFKYLQHIDLYRFENATNSDAHEVNDWLMNKEALTFVEWPENLKLSNKDLNLLIKIEQAGEKARKVEFKWF